MAYVYQEKAIERIKKGLRRMQGIVERAVRDEYKEADTRKIVSDMLSEYLGWDKFENVTAEQMIGSRYADYVVKTKDEEVFVIEVKQIGLKLKGTHLNQARQYAVDEGIDWVILTNGDEWQAYRTSIEGKIPVTRHVFTVKITDPDVKPAEKARLLYLFSEEANRKKEIEAYYQRRVALSGRNLANHVLSDGVLNRIRIDLKNETGQILKNSEIANALMKRLFADDYDDEESAKLVKKAERAERQKAQKPKQAEAEEPAEQQE